MNRIDRLNALLIHLQGKPRVCIEELEDRFEVSRRTIFRDVRSLMEAGVPIGGDAGEGYFIVEGYHLPPVVFNKEEAAALLMGAKFIQQNADTQTARTFEEAMFKVKAVLRYSDKEFLENLDARIAIRPFPRQKENDETFISDIQSAVATNRVIQITYHSHYNDTSTGREVEPLGMVFYSSHWHLIGYCRLRQDLRDFRTDRIKKFDNLSEQFDPSLHPNFLSFLHDSLVGTDAKECIIRVSRIISRFMGEQKYYHGYVDEEPVSDDKIEMRFIVPHHDYFARWLLMYGKEIEVVTPEELREIISNRIQELVDHHQIFENSQL